MCCRIVLRSQLQTRHLVLRYRHVSLTLEQYEEAIEWAPQGFHHMLRMCRGSQWCRNEARVEEQGYGVLGNAFVAYAFHSRGYSVMVEPQIERVTGRCSSWLRSEMRYDIAVHSEYTDALLLLEVKVYRRRRGVPEYPNVEAVYRRELRPRSLVKRCNMLVLGVLILLNELPRGVSIPSYVVAVQVGKRREDAGYTYEEIIRRARKYGLTL